MSPPHYNFEACSENEMFDELMHYSRARFYSTKKRYRNSHQLLHKLCEVYAKVKEAHKELRRGEKFKGQTRAGKLWRGIKHRCNPEWAHKHPSYEGCKMSKNFCDLEFFHSWCSEQKGFYEKDEKGAVFEIDKDILALDGQKLYGEDVCVFVPKEINCFARVGKQFAGDLLPGVHVPNLNGRFMTQFGKKHHGTFDTEYEAFLAYKCAKEVKAKELAKKWKDKIDPRVHDFLMTYELPTPDLTEHVLRSKMVRLN